MLVFEPFYTDGLAQISYLIGDSKAAVAAVIDPRRDIDIYLQMAKARGLRIAYAIETHIHADFVSGARRWRSAPGHRSSAVARITTSSSFARSAVARP